MASGGWRGHFFARNDLGLFVLIQCKLFRAYFFCKLRYNTIQSSSLDTFFTVTLHNKRPLLGFKGHGEHGAVVRVALIPRTTVLVTRAFSIRYPLLCSFYRAGLYGALPLLPDRHKGQHGEIALIDCPKRPAALDVVHVCSSTSRFSPLEDCTLYCCTAPSAYTVCASELTVTLHLLKFWLYVVFSECFASPQSATMYFDLICH